MDGSTQHIRLSMFIQGYLLGCHAWIVRMPSSIRGLKGSCIVIPCSYAYDRYPPKNPEHVVWYQYVSKGYPLVFDDWYPNDVIENFRFKTRRIGPSNECSLEINPVTWSHHRQKIYPWVDPENVGKSTYAFYDTTVTIEVQDRAESPVIQIIGSLKVGQEVTVQCHVVHTCPTQPPTLSLSVPTQSRRPTHESLSDGTSRTTLTASMLLQNDQQSVKCSVKHPGGVSAEAEKTFNAQCHFWPLTISPDLGEFLEGKSREVICAVDYTCSKHVPTLSWNYEGMPTSTEVKKLEAAKWRSASTLTFTASTKDQGRSLTCHAHFTGGQVQKKSITLQVKRSILSRDWSFTTPGSITAVIGSCVVIPCSFTYVTAQPVGLSVKWYLYQSHGHPLVFDKGQTAVIDKYRGRTGLTGSMEQSNCSLQIERLEMSHNQDRLYPWIDKTPITAYHSFEQNFYDKTVQLVISDNAQQPQMTILGIPRVGGQSTVSCSVRHTCPLNLPTLILNKSPGPADRITHNAMPSGLWEMTVERSWNVREEDQSVSCTVTYPGGQTATSEIKLDLECPFEITIDEPGFFTEGVAKHVICSVSYKCRRDKPDISWNCDNMHSSVHTQEISKGTYKTLSNLTFIANLDDNGKDLTCLAQFIDGQTSASTSLLVKKHKKQIQDTSTYNMLAADVLPKVSALTRSCVVVPCTFQVKDEPITNLRGIWYNRAGGFVYHNGQSLVLDHFKGRTRILGDLDQQNCTLEIDDIKPFDNGPFCFRAETTEDIQYGFNNSCVFIIMRASPEKPVMSPIPEEVNAGSTVTVTCSVKHTCPSHPPMVSWSMDTVTTEVRDTWIGQGIWETTSTVTFVPTRGDGPKYLNCTALFWRGKKQTNTARINVKGSLMFQLRSAVPIVAPASAVGLVILAMVIGVVVWRKRSDNAVRPPPRPEKRRSLWDRLYSSRHRQRPPRPEKKQRTPIGWE